MGKTFVELEERLELSKGSVFKWCVSLPEYAKNKTSLVRLLHRNVYNESGKKIGIVIKANKTSYTDEVELVVEVTSL